MKRSFLRLHFLNELTEPLIRQRVRYADHEDAVVVDLLVEFVALVTHSSFRIGANGSPDWLLLIALKCSNGGIVHKSPGNTHRSRKLGSGGSAKQRNLKSI
jgi:hypothetical protein